MDAYKVDAGTEVILKIKRESTVAEFETVSIDHINNCLVVEPILHEGKIVNFAIPEITREVNLLDKNLGKIFAWKDVEVKAGYYHKTRLCHLIYLPEERFEINRRGYFRQYIGLEATAAALRRPKDNIIIRDMSNTGLGFISERRGSFEVGRSVTVYLDDSDEGFKFDIPCKIVRERTLENGSLEFGCLLDEPNAAIAKYVAHKQLVARRRALGVTNR